MKKARSFGNKTSLSIPSDQRLGKTVLQDDPLERRIDFFEALL
jgi:hypothetical protein